MGMEWIIGRWNELGNATGRNTSLVRVWEQHEGKMVCLRLSKGALRENREMECLRRMRGWEMGWNEWRVNVSESLKL